MVKRNSVAVLVIFICCGLIGNDDYSNPEIATAREELNAKFILKVAEVQTIKQGKKIEAQWTKHLENDPMMAKLEQIKKEGTSGTALGVIKMAEDVEKDFEHQNAELFNQLSNASLGKHISFVVTGLGLALALYGITDKNTPGALCGSAVTLGGCGGYYYNARAANQLPIAITTLNKMDKEFSMRFTEQNPSKENN